MAGNVNRIAEIIALGMVARWIELHDISWVWNRSEVMRVNDEDGAPTASVQIAMCDHIPEHSVVMLVCSIKKDYTRIPKRPRYIPDKMQIFGRGGIDEPHQVFAFEPPPVLVPVDKGMVEPTPDLDLPEAGQ